MMMKNTAKWMLALTICSTGMFTACDKIKAQNEATEQKDLPLAVQHPEIPLE